MWRNKDRVYQGCQGQNSKLALISLLSCPKTKQNNEVPTPKALPVSSWLVPIRRTKKI